MDIMLEQYLANEQSLIVQKAKHLQKEQLEKKSIAQISKSKKSFAAAMIQDQSTNSEWEKDSS